MEGVNWAEHRERLKINRNCGNIRIYRLGKEIFL